MTTGACSQNVGKLFSELKLLTDNLFIMQKPTEKSQENEICYTYFFTEHASTTSTDM